jgi:DNA-binding transcriptional regulator YbjK
MPDDRQSRILDAAITVLGAEGSRGLTHRAVDAAAGLPAGSASNHFRSRSALITGIVNRMETLDRLEWQAMSAATPPTGVAGLALALGAFVGHALGPARARTSARYVLFLEAAAKPELRESLAGSRAEIHRWGTPWIERLGSTRPAEHTDLVLDYLDGLILHQLAFPRAGFDPVPGIRELLAGLAGD